MRIEHLCPCLNYYEDSFLEMCLRSEVSKKTSLRKKLESERRLKQGNTLDTPPGSDRVRAFTAQTASAKT